MPPAPAATSRSVVIASFRERPLVEAALAALLPQCRASGAELLLARPERAEPWLSAWPEVRLVPAPAGASLPVIRGAGLAAARGEMVLLTEDHCVAEPGWVDRLCAALEATDVAGGGMGNAQAGRSVDWAAFFAEYGFFSSSRPAEDGHALVTGANVGYRRPVAAEVARWMLAGEWENVVHDRLAARGVRFRFVPEARVLQNQRYRFGGFCRDRYDHGYAYARRRLAEAPGTGRWTRVLAAPLLMFVLFRRVARAARGENPGAFRRAAPLTLAFLGAWSLGEAAGYLAGAAPAELS